jgi:hypothetical protein
MNPAERLAAEAIAMRELHANVIDATNIGTYAIERGIRNWPVFPGNGKIPAIPNPHPEGSIERQTCKGECGLDGHGVLDATIDVEKIGFWWGGKYAGCNILGRVPESMFVVDVDPRHDGARSIAALEERYGLLPETLMTVSGRMDGGVHYFYRRPTGNLSSKRLGPGIDIKTSTGYVVLPPSIHPDTRKPYLGVDKPVADPPAWLIDLLLPAHRITPPRPRSPLQGRLRGFFSGSIADKYDASTTWPEILMPHGWSCLDPDTDADGAKWVHPTATAKWSATIRHGLLFVYSTNTPFEVTESGNAKGHTKFRAFAVLNHGGDMSAAARALMAVSR